MLISCVCPTYNRAEFIGVTIDSFLSQTYKQKELIILDNGDDATESMIPEASNIHYFRMRGDRLRIGDMRNRANALSVGELIAHFDSDDWSAPTRIEEQFALLEESKKDVTGYNSLLFWNDETQEASRYSGDRNYALGSSLCYRASFWKQHEFPNTSVGEDNWFGQQAKNEGQLVSVDGRQMMVARIHPGNTSAKTGRLQWPKVERSDIPQQFFEAMKHA